MFLTSLRGISLSSSIFFPITMPASLSCLDSLQVDWAHYEVLESAAVGYLDDVRLALLLLDDARLPLEARVRHAARLGGDDVYVHALPWLEFLQVASDRGSAP